MVVADPEADYSELRGCRVGIGWSTVLLSQFYEFLVGFQPQSYAFLRMAIMSPTSGDGFVPPAAHSRRANVTRQFTDSTAVDHEAFAHLNRFNQGRKLVINKVVGARSHSVGSAVAVLAHYRQAILVDERF